MAQPCSMLPWVLLFVGLTGTVGGVDRNVYPAVPGDWGYYRLSSGGNMFYWFMQQQAPQQQQQEEGIVSMAENLISGVVTATPAPRLMILMEGDPLASSVGVMNVGRLGPYDLGLRFRNTTPLTDASLLFMDAPVGSGWSYATSENQFSRTYQAVAQDLTEFLTQHWFPAHPAALGHEVTIFAQSVAAEPAILLAQNLKQTNSPINLKYIILSGPELASIDTTFGRTEFLKDSANIEPMEKRALDKLLTQLAAVSETAQREKTQQLYAQFEDLVTSITYGLHLENIIAPAPKGHFDIRYDGERQVRLGQHTYRAVQSKKSYDEFQPVMEGPVRRMFMQSNSTKQAPQIVWGSQYEQALNLLQGDRFKRIGAVLPAVDYLLSTSDVQIAILSAQLDALQPTIGTFAALKRLRWDGRSAFFQSRKDVFLGPVGGPQVFRKVHDKLSFYMVERSGHYVSDDKPNLFSAILSDVWSRSYPPFQLQSTLSLGVGKRTVVN